MPPPITAPPIRVDRQAEYPIVLGESLKQQQSGYSSLKYNYKPPSLLLNPSKPSITPVSKKSDSASVSLSFAPPTAGAPKITYAGTSTNPPSRIQHFLLFDPNTKSFTLEKLDTAFVFNADVYAKLHPPVQPESTGSDGEDGGEGDSEDDDSGGAYDWRHFVGKKKKTAAEEKQQKRLEALKRAGRDVVDIPAEPSASGTGEGGLDDGTYDINIPDVPAVGESSEEEEEEEHVFQQAPPQPTEEDDLDMDAPGESEEDEPAPAPAPLPPPPPPSAPPKKKVAPKKAPANPLKAPPKSRGLPKKKAAAQPQPPPPPPAEDEFVLPDITPSAGGPPLSESDEDLEFSSDEDEGVVNPPHTQAQQHESVPTPQAPPGIEEDDEAIDDEFVLDIGKELEEALVDDDGGNGGGGGLVFDEDDDDDNRGGNNGGLGVAAGNGGPQSLSAIWGGGVEDESESEEE